MKSCGCVKLKIIFFKWNDELFLCELEDNENEEKFITKLFFFCLRHPTRVVESYGVLNASMQVKGNLLSLKFLLAQKNIFWSL